MNPRVRLLVCWSSCFPKRVGNYSQTTHTPFTLVYYEYDKVLRFMHTKKTHFLLFPTKTYFISSRFDLRGQKSDAKKEFVRELESVDGWIDKL